MEASGDSRNLSDHSCLGSLMCLNQLGCFSSGVRRGKMRQVMASVGGWLISVSGLQSPMAH